MFELVLANLSRRVGRTALSASGVAIGVTTVVALLALTAGISRSAGDLANLGGADFGVFQGGLADLTASSLPAFTDRRIAAQPGVADASPVQILAHAISQRSPVLVFGAQPSSYLARRLVLVAGRRPVGAQALAGVKAAETLHLQVGRRIAVEGRPFTLAGIFRSGVSLEDAGIVLPLASTRELSGRSDISMVAVSIKPGYRQVSVARGIERQLPGTLALGDPSEVARVDTNSQVLRQAALIIGVLALALGAVVVMNTMAMAIIERRGEFGVLSAVGWSSARIDALILAESLTISLVGALVGIGLGVLTSELLVHALSAQVLVSPYITPRVLFGGLLVGISLGVLGALFCVWRIRSGTLIASLKEG